MQIPTAWHRSRLTLCRPLSRLARKIAAVIGTNRSTSIHHQGFGLLGQSCPRYSCHKAWLQPAIDQAIRVSAALIEAGAGP